MRGLILVHQGHDACERGRCGGSAADDGEVVDTRREVAGRRTSGDAGAGADDVTTAIKAWACEERQVRQIAMIVIGIPVTPICQVGLP